MARPEMKLLKQRKLAELIKPPKGSAVLEASGVVAKGGDYYVIFDNVRRVARIDRGLSPVSKRHAWLGPRLSGDGYEDIAYSPHLKRFYLLVEAEKHMDGTYKGLIDECDETGRLKGRHWIDFTLPTRNTGFEGLSAVRVKHVSVCPLSTMSSTIRTCRPATLTRRSITKRTSREGSAPRA